MINISLFDDFTKKIFEYANISTPVRGITSQEYNFEIHSL